MANEVRLAEVAEPVFGITRRRYEMLAAAGRVPRTVNGRIDLVRAIRALIQHYREIAESHPPSLMEERRLKVMAERRLKELEYALETKNLIPRSEIPLMFSARKKMVRRGLEQLCRSLPAKLLEQDARAMADIIRAEVRALLTWYSRGGDGMLALPSPASEGRVKNRRKGG